MELYDISSSEFYFLAKYHSSSAKFLEMTVVRLPKEGRHAVVLFLPEDKVFLTLNDII